MSIVDTVTKAMVPIHREGWPFIAICACRDPGCSVGFIRPALLDRALIITGWICYFFRDPKRVTPVGDGLVISPADGVVSHGRPRHGRRQELEIGSEPLMRVSIFMNVFNCHVNRAPGWRASILNASPTGPASF